MKRCESHCSFRGTHQLAVYSPGHEIAMCNSFDGTCQCKKGFEGYDCDIPVIPCSPGTYGYRGIKGGCKPCDDVRIFQFF